MKITKYEAEKIIRIKGQSFGLERYQYIMETVNKVDISKSADFQRTFNGFYVVRGRSAEWRKIYYELFERMKSESADFEKIITILYKKTGDVEASFSSKMLATLNADKPIWDKYVMENVDLKLVGKNQEEKVKNAIALYEDLEKWYSYYLDTVSAKNCLRVFDKEMPQYQWISSVKKIDCFIWSMERMSNDKMTAPIYGRFVDPKPSDFVNRPLISDECEEEFDGEDIKRDRFTSTAADVGKAKLNKSAKAAQAILNGKTKSSSGKNTGRKK